MIERGFRDEDESSLLDLLRSSYNGWYQRDHWVWKFSENPHGHPIISVAEDKGRIVGCYILNPVRIRIGQVSVLGAQSVDAAVDAAYRGRGVFTKLARYTMKRAFRKRLVITYAFPSKIAYKGQVRIGFRPIFVIPKMHKILNANQLVEGQQYNWFFGRALSILGRLPKKVNHERVYTEFGEYLTIKKTYSFDSRFGVFHKKICEQNTNIQTDRDPAYLSWRYLKKPENSYDVYVCEEDNEVAGYIVVTTEKLYRNGASEKLSVGRIVDLLSLPGKNYASLLVAHSLDYFKHKKVGVIECWMLRNHPYHTILHKFGFSDFHYLLWRTMFGSRETGQVILYVNSKNILTKALGSKPTPRQLRWFVTQGDADYT